MMATASFKIPSPNIIEKSFGYSSYLIIEMAAITSDEQRSEPIRRDSIKVNSNDYTLKIAFK